MTPQQRREISRYLEAFDFSGLFTDPSVGWDWPDSGRTLRVPFGEDFISLQPIAEKKGVRILQVPPLKDGSIMPSGERKKLEKATTPLATEHLLIFVDKAKTRQIWQWTSRLPGKPVRHRELTWEKGRSNELLLQKLTSIAFTLKEEEDGLDITGVVQRLRDNLDRDRLTKQFYEDFKRQKDQFQKFIEGIGDSGILAHYTSLMLNRLMFCYFLQKKGFLNGEEHYLRNRLNKVRDTLGEDKFHSFYRSFLKRLFFDGLDGEDRPADLVGLIGEKIPYLNGGIFSEHPIERDHPEITIPDEAFEKIFVFFDKWQWHLDDRPLVDTNEINPEVLGYVFEKYTNQKEMGAYYTKEDITEYISKNTILPFLLKKVAAKLPSEAWELLKNDPDRYIYEAVKRGAGPDEDEWRKSLPENIAIGLDSKAPKLIDRRKDWNTSTPATHSLPTEIWRETIARHQRCHELRKKLRAGEVADPADLVTLNLDIRQFVSDVIASAPADLALALWNTLRSLSVLDPTCGSGAFLFAALEILEPLYEGLLERFRALLADWQTSGEKHKNWEKEFGAILGAVERHPNEGYFIHKTVIVHNLYGVDIMEEAVEICKLRLFLKLAAQLELGQEIEPLPDIDFNVRAGNTLVGYASREEIRKAFTEARGGVGGEQMALLGIENSLDDYTHIMEQAEDADRAFQRFQDLQDTIGQSAHDFRSAKESLESRLQALRAQLDRFLAGQYDQKHIKTDVAFQKWKESHEPFHWFVEFYGIMNSGGFDVIVGNPPYAEIPKGLGRSMLCSIYRTALPQWSRDEDLYTLVFERSISVLSDKGSLSLILPLSIAFSTKRPYVSLRELIQNLSGRWLFSHFDRIPSALFGNDVRTRCTIATLIRFTDSDSCSIFTSAMQRWANDLRPLLFPRIQFARINLDISGGIPKVGSQTQADFLDALLKLRSPLAACLNNSISFSRLDQAAPNFPDKAVYVGGTAYNWLPAWREIPETTKPDGSASLPARTAGYGFASDDEANQVFGLLCSCLGYWWWAVASDGFNLKKWLIERFPICPDKLDSADRKKLSHLGKTLRKALKKQYVYKSNRGVIGNFFLPGCASETTAIDNFLASAIPFAQPATIDEIRGFNSSFSRSSTDSDEDNDE